MYVMDMWIWRKVGMITCPKCDTEFKENEPWDSATHTPDLLARILPDKKLTDMYREQL
jgi:hypothetical protein